MANEGFDQRILQVQAPIGSRTLALALHAACASSKNTSGLAQPEAVFSPHVPLRERSANVCRLSRAG